MLGAYHAVVPSSAARLQSTQPAQNTEAKKDLSSPIQKAVVVHDFPELGCMDHVMSLMLQLPQYLHSLAGHESAVLMRSCLPSDAATCVRTWKRKATVGHRQAGRALLGRHGSRRVEAHGKV